MGNKLENTARSFGRRTSPAFFSQQIDELNALQINPLGIISQWDQLTLNLYNRTAEKSFTANDGSLCTPVIHNKNEIRSLVNFLFRKGMCNLSNWNMGPCQPVFVSISHRNVPPLPSINRLTPYGSGFSTHVSASLIQNCYAVALASASWSACCSFTNYLCKKRSWLFRKAQFWPLKHSRK